MTDHSTDSLRRTVADVAGLVPGPTLPIDRLDVVGSAEFAAAFDVDTASLVSTGLANLAAGIEQIDRDRVVTAFTAHAEVDGRSVPKWADLSGYYRTADGGFIQLHCNFPHHAAGVVDRLACEPNRADVQRAVLEQDPASLEANLIGDGMIAARMRTLEEWSRHPHAAATAALPLITVERIGEAPPRELNRRPRVLDCSRVLAGPVTGMTLAAHGADVLRVGAAHLPTVEIGVIATGFGKRNTNADLTTAQGRSDFDRLLADCDIWIDAYRPGSFADRGYPVDAGPPGSITIQISAFDWEGPWAGRRGYDSIVQTTTGIVAAGIDQSNREAPTPLPVQALDFCTGYLGAFVAHQLLHHQAQVGGTWLARLSLLRTRNWLVGLRRPRSFEPRPAEPVPAALHSVMSPFGRLTAARAVGGGWKTPPQPLGGSPPQWIAPT